MRATGIVRRIDELGRLVIPKEIRRTYRISEGDPIEIYTSEDGEVVLKKYSPVGELGDFAKEYAESLAKTSCHAVCISDKEKIIAASGVSKKLYINKMISRELLKIINDRTIYLNNCKTRRPLMILHEEEDTGKYKAQMLYPIVSDGEAVGAIIMFSTEPGVAMGETESKLAQSAAYFLGSNIGS